MAVTPQTRQTTLAEFRAKIRNTELSRTERFECTFQFPASMQKVFSELGGAGNVTREATILCEEVQIPGMVLQNKEVPIGTWNFMRNSNVAFLGNEINLTFLTDSEWRLRHVFEAWIAHCINPQNKRVAFPDDQYGTLWINLLGLDDLVRTTWEMREVTPKVLNLVPLATGSTSISRTTLIISSAYWTSKVIDIDLNKNDGSNLGFQLDVKEEKEEESDIAFNMDPPDLNHLAALNSVLSPNRPKKAVPRGS